MSLPSPTSSLRASVVVPAQNEEALVGDCLRALAHQEGISLDEYEVLLVLDRCTDGTGDRAREAARECPDLRLHFLDGLGRGAGHARRTGMEAACERLLGLGRPGGLIASTDADTVVAPDWLAEQLGAMDRGARAVGGCIELDDGSLPDGVARWRAEQGRLRYRDLPEAATMVEPEHWHFSGASLALTAELYREIGGLEPRAALEDEHLERMLHERGVPIERPLAVRVKTSARLAGRARRGLARDLSLASWHRRNTYDAGDFDHDKLLASKRSSVSVVVPVPRKSSLQRAPDELAPHRKSGLVDELILVGAGAEEATDADDTFYRAPELAPGSGPVRGLGDLMQRGLAAASGEVVIFVDPDRPDPDRLRLPGLLGPLFENEELELVQGFYGDPDQLTELVARPLINLHFPELAGLIDPLSTDLAARRMLLEALPFPAGDGVRLSLPLDAARKTGADALAQADLGARQSPPERATPEAAYAVLAAVAARLPGGEGPEDLAPGPLFLPASDTLETRRVALEERPPLREAASDPT